MKSILGASVLAMVEAHSHPYHDDTCTCEAGAKAFESYHIHVLFYPDLSGGQFADNTHGSAYARALRQKAVEQFNIPECDEGSIFDLDELCAFAVDETGAGGEQNAAPFVAPNFAFFLPVDRYAEVVPWFMANRGDLDFLLHPNSCGFTCSPQDHLLWSMWAGNKWDVRFVLDESMQVYSTSDSESDESSHEEAPHTEQK